MTEKDTCRFLAMCVECHWAARPGIHLEGAGRGERAVWDDLDVQGPWGHCRERGTSGDLVSSCLRVPGILQSRVELPTSSPLRALVLRTWEGVFACQLEPGMVHAEGLWQRDPGRCSGTRLWVTQTPRSGRCHG